MAVSCLINGVAGFLPFFWGEGERGWKSFLDSVTGI